jgi:hypothetical protein
MRYVKTILSVLAVATVAAACVDTSVSRSEMQSVDYGPKPAGWQDEIKSYLRIRLTDPKDAIVEFRTEPRQMYQKATEVRDRQWGWAVCLWLNDKNSSGYYDGYYPMTVFLRDEKIVAVNNGPDDFGVIGATYARRQCAELGAPFEQRR